jgi:hypothetical protein
MPLIPLSTRSPKLKGEDPEINPIINTAGVAKRVPSVFLLFM